MPYSVRERLNPLATLVIFGSTGDLTRRLLMPALFCLHKADLLPCDIRLVLYARRPVDVHELIEHMGTPNCSKPSVDEVASFARRFTAPVYGALDAEGVSQLRDVVKGDGLFYLALPPGIFAQAAEALGEAGLNDESEYARRLIVEKPFGHDLQSALQLQQRVSHYWKEEQLYRIDHYLGKETVQNLLVMRFANILFESVWNRNYVDHVQIVAAETLGLEGRPGYYDQSGALRDMVQNHLMQMFALTAMEAPPRIQSHELRNEKVKVLQSVRPIPNNAVSAYAVRGQYSEGIQGGHTASGYLQEAGVAENSRTETYAAVKLYVDNWRWQGVPFYLRTGKRLSGNRSEIMIQLKHPPVQLFQNTQLDVLQPNQFIFELKPNESIRLVAQAKKEGLQLDPRSVELVSPYRTEGGGFGAYEMLILDAFVGDRTHFLRIDEVEWAWRVLDPIIKSWENESVPLYQYDSGSDGPREALRILDSPAHVWRPLS